MKRSNFFQLRGQRSQNRRPRRRRGEAGTGGSHDDRGPGTGRNS